MLDSDEEKKENTMSLQGSCQILNMYLEQGHISLI